ncbi:helix-turn-helix domain-containing protein [Micromonospora inyonensis]|uniref:Helix-turn-helix domain-containing protein n=1 Tax=Micromonospora inyonensis TaxID=47866 RepID=A0A1C6SVC7_9ACTN|nr:helix-turn-helix transcriptional regulator [Micromonospora inyonensis]SCL15000.1 Helix-turn-helix domain-containing protein [Micromonospora inyonensis]SCL33427.1 Helix-turn-helix domain-containing protein [Micromonospora inyonensis]SCL33514.1 Helix-turn-helix domain-containing protein [Micromonospora inyonensis]
MDSLGRQIAKIRGRRGMSQRELAAAAGVSVDLVSKLEQGQRKSARLESVAALAHALDVTPAELLGKPRGLAAGAEDGEIGAIRRAVLGLRPDHQDPPTRAAQTAAIDDLWSAYWSGRYAHLARQLPDRVDQARALTRDGRPADHALLASALQLTGSLLAHLAHEDLAHLALTEAGRAAEASGDHLLHAAQQATRSWVLSRQGLWSEAEHVAITAAASVEPTLSRSSVDQVALWGELLRYGTTAVARSGRQAEATELLGLVGAAASRMGHDQATRYVGRAFGPTVARMKAVDVAVSGGQPRRAIRLADQVEHPEAAPTAMHARYLLNVAWAQTMDWRSQDAVDTLRRVEALTPELLLHQTLAHTIVAELLPRRHRQRLPGLAALADRMGVPR